MKTLSKGYYAGCFLSVFLLIAGALSVQAVWTGRSETQAVSFSSIVGGEWASEYETVFNENLSLYDISKSLWTYINYKAFRIGKEGVLVGEEGWLFSNEEFIEYPNHKKNIKENTAYVSRVHSFLKQEGIELIVVAVPSKARIYSQHLGRYRFPSHNEKTYHGFRKDLKNDNILSADIQWIMEKKKDKFDVFLKTDTHWTPAGAKMAARTIYSVYEKSLQSTLDLEYEHRISLGGEHIEHVGDLLEFVPLGRFLEKTDLKTDSLKQYKNEVIEELKQQEEVNKDQDLASLEALFGEKEISVALVGTSYSANPLWGFEGFLKEIFKTDILNVSDEGMGPFKTMENYLENDAFKTNVPKLVIWEIPERYLAVHYDMKRTM